MDPGPVLRPNNDGCELCQMGKLSILRVNLKMLPVMLGYKLVRFRADQRMPAIIRDG
jgi:hypothetical protein